MIGRLRHIPHLGVVAVIAAISGCVSQPVASSSVTQIDTGQKYEAALHECRKLQPGRLNKRMNLPATSLRVSACLREKGWGS